MNHYQVLQVKHNATQQEIKQSYRRLAKQFHPDSQPANEGSDKIVALNAAYEILGNSKSRRTYDRQQQLGQTSDFWNSQQTRNAAAQKQNQQQRAYAPPDISYEQWLQEIYFPIHRLASQILEP